MNINGNKTIISTKKTSLFLFFIFYLLFIFGIHIYYKDFLYPSSVHLFKHLQECCLGLSYTSYFFEYFTDMHVTYICISIVFVFVNIYKTFILVAVICISNYLVGFLGLLYKGTRPFWDVVPVHRTYFSCELNWGTPSYNSITIAAYLTIWRIIFNNDKLKEYKKTKIISLVILLLFLAFLDLTGIFQGTESFDQVLFGLSLGFAIYFFFFYVVCVDLNNSYELYKFLQISYFKLALLLVLSSILAIIIYFWDPNYVELSEDRMKNINMIHQCQDVGLTLQFNKFSFSVICTSISLIGVYIGMKFELMLYFKNDFDNWSDFNFVKDKSENESLLSEMTVTKDAQWNHTNSFISFLRFMFTAMILIIFHLPKILINHDSFPITIFIRIILPHLCYAFFKMYPFKILLLKMNILNQTKNIRVKKYGIKSMELEQDE